MSFCCCCYMIPLRIPHYFWLPYLFRLLLIVTVSQSFFVFEDLGSLRSIGQWYCKMTFYWGSSNNILMIRLDLWVWGRKIAEEDHHIILRVHTIKIIYSCWCWIGQLKQFFTVRLFLQKHYVGKDSWILVHTLGYNPTPFYFVLFKLFQIWPLRTLAVRHTPITVRFVFVLHVGMPSLFSRDWLLWPCGL